MLRALDIIKRPALTALLLYLSGGDALAQSADERWYKVELLAFTRDTANGGEYFEPRPVLAYPSAARFLHFPERILNVEARFPNRTSVDEFGRILVAPRAAYKQPKAQNTFTARLPPAEARAAIGSSTDEITVGDLPLRPTAFVALTANYKELGAAALRLSRQGGYHVQFHETWLQPIAARSEALPLVLDSSGDAGQWPVLQGSVLLYRSRYLHIETNLWRNTSGSGLPPLWRMPAPPLGPLQLVVEKAAKKATGLPPLWQEPAEIQQAAAAPPVLRQSAEVQELDPVYPYRHAIALKLKRRMRRNELHYLDHPAMGVVLKITALDEDILDTMAESELMQPAKWPRSLSRVIEP